MASSWNYINKIWNVSRFIKMNLVANNYQGEEIDYNNLTSLDKWILNKMNLLIKDVDSNMIFLNLVKLHALFIILLGMILLQVT